MRIPFVRIPVVALALYALGCESPMGVDRTVTVSIVGDSLRLENPTLRPAYFFAVEAETAARINWAPCTDPSKCQAVPPQGTLSIPLAEVTGFEADSEVALVYWWHLVARLGSHRSPEIRCTGARRS